MGGVYGFGMDLREIFEGWLRSRVAGERPGFAPGSVTEGGYEMDTEGMRSWVADTAEFVVWLAANEPEMFGEFRFRYRELDREGWDALVGFGGGFHDKPAGPPDESQLDSDVEVLVTTPVGDTEDPPVPPPTTTTVSPPTTTTGPPPKPKPKPKPKPTPDPPPTTSVAPPPTTTLPPMTALPPAVTEVLPEPAATEVLPEHEGRHANIGQGFERMLGHPEAEWEHGLQVNNYGSLMPNRRDFSQAGWDPVIGFIGGVVSTLFDFFGDSGPVGSHPGPTSRADFGGRGATRNSAAPEATQTYEGAEDPRPSASLSGGQNPSFWAGRVISDR